MDRVCLCSILHSAHVKNFNGSSYIFYRSNGRWHNWDRSKKICKEQSGYDLVSIESREEWKFLNQIIQKEDTIEYFIGLWKDTSIGVWRWLSDNSTVNASSRGHWPWAKDEPNNENRECNCALMSEITLITLAAIMMSALLHPYPEQDSYVNLKVEEVIDP